MLGWENLEWLQEKVYGGNYVGMGMAGLTIEMIYTNLYKLIYRLLSEYF